MSIFLGREIRVSAIILTGGIGRRIMKTKLPKQFIEVDGRPIFVHCLEIYDKIDEVDEICLVINGNYREFYDKCLRQFPFKKITNIVDGGVLRQDSVRNGVDVITHDGLVVLQNGVNATTPADLIKRCIILSGREWAVTAYIRSFHTVFTKDRGRLEGVLDRDGIGYTCDPQVYGVDVIRKALDYAEMETTNDIPTVELVKRIGHPVALVESDTRNIKLTTELDLKIIEHILTDKGPEGRDEII